MAIVADDSVQFTWSMMDVDISKPSDSMLLLPENCTKLDHPAQLFLYIKHSRGIQACQRTCYCQSKGTTKGITVIKYLVKIINLYSNNNKFMVNMTI